MPQSDYPILGAARQIYTHLLTNRNRGDNTLMLLQKILIFLYLDFSFFLYHATKAYEKLKRY